MVDEVKVAEKNKTLESLRKIDDNLRLPSVPERRVFPKEIDVSQARMQTPAVGQRATRPDGRMHGLGQTKYIDDMFFPGMIHAKIKRAGIAHAKIKSIDVSEAERMPGVMATLIGSEIPVNSFGPSLQDQPLLADKVVRHAGDGVAAVAAGEHGRSQGACRRARWHGGGSCREACCLARCRCCLPPCAPPDREC